MYFSYFEIKKRIDISNNKENICKNKIKMIRLSYANLTSRLFNLSTEAIFFRPICMTSKVVKIHIHQ